MKSAASTSAIAMNAVVRVCFAMRVFMPTGSNG